MSSSSRRVPQAPSVCRRCPVYQSSCLSEVSQAASKMLRFVPSCACRGESMSMVSGRSLLGRTSLRRRCCTRRRWRLSPKTPRFTGVFCVHILLCAIECPGRACVATNPGHRLKEDAAACDLPRRPAIGRRFARYHMKMHLSHLSLSLIHI